MVGSGEFFGEIREIGESEFAGVGLFADAEEADGVIDGVAIFSRDINLRIDRRFLACFRHTVGRIVHSR